MREPLIKKYRWGVFAFCFILVIWRAFNVTTSNGNGRDNVYGDSFSDKNVLSAVKFYNDYGFDTTCWLPVQQYDGKGDSAWIAYSHYPPLPDILAGIYSKILGTTRETPLRLVAFIWGILLFFIIYNVLDFLLKDKTQAFIGGTLLVLSNYYLAWADNLHKHTLEELAKWVYLYCIYRYYNEEENKNKWLVWMCVIFLFAVNVSFEPPVYLAIVSIGFSLLYQRKIFTKTTILPGISAVTGFMLHMWQNAAYFGSWQTAFDDMKAAFLLRTAGQETEGITVNEIGDKSFNLLDIFFEWFNRIERFYLIPGWAILILGTWGIWHMYQNRRKLFYITLTLFIATIAWSFVMMHHAYVHLFTSRQWGIFLAVVCGYTLPLYYEQVRKAIAERNSPLIVMHSLFVLYIAAMAISQQVYAMWLKNGFLFGYL